MLTQSSTTSLQLCMNMICQNGPAKVIKRWENPRILCAYEAPSIYLIFDRTTKGITFHKRKVLEAVISLLRFWLGVLCCYCLHSFFGGASNYHWMFWEWHATASSLCITHINPFYERKQKTRKIMRYIENNRLMFDPKTHATTLCDILQIY